MAEAVPPAIVGETVNLLASGAPDIGSERAAPFLSLACAFPAVDSVSLFLCPLLQSGAFSHQPPSRRRGGPDTANKVPADRRVYFLPDVMIDEAFFLIGFTALMVFLTAFFFSAPLESIANPQSTPLHAVAPWYFYWLQGLLKIADKMIAGVDLAGCAAGAVDGDSLSGSQPKSSGT
jgi:hypothetical protein